MLLVMVSFGTMVMSMSMSKKAVEYNIWLQRNVENLECYLKF